MKYFFDAFNKFDSQGNISSQGTNSIGLIPINVRVLPLGRVNQGDTVSLSKTIGPYIQATTIMVQVASLQATKKTEKGKEIIEVNLPSKSQLGEGKEFTLEAGEKREIFYDFSFSNPPIYFSDGREMYLFEQVVTKKGSETPDSTSIHAVILGADNANNPTGLWGSNILVYEQPNLPIASKEVSFNYSLFNVIETPLASIQSKAFIDSSKIFFSLFSNALGLTSFKADAREPLNSVPQSQINYHFEGVFNSEGRAAGFAFIDGYGIGVFNNAGFDSASNELRGVEYSVVFNNESFRNKNSASNSVAWNLFENFSASSIRFGGRPQDLITLKWDKLGGFKDIYAIALSDGAINGPPINAFLGFFYDPEGNGKGPAIGFKGDALNGTVSLFLGNAIFSVPTNGIKEFSSNDASVLLTGFQSSISLNEISKIPLIEGNEVIQTIINRIRFYLTQIKLFEKGKKPEEIKVVDLRISPTETIIEYIKKTPEGDLIISSIEKQPLQKQ